METGKLRQQLLGMFLQEVRERTQELEHDLIALHTESNSPAQMELIKKLLRHSHSLKGTAGLVEERSIEAACHWMEELLISIRDHRRELDEAMQELLLGATNAIAESGRCLSRGESAESGPLSMILPQLIGAGQADRGRDDASADMIRFPPLEEISVKVPLSDVSPQNAQIESHDRRLVVEPAKIETYIRVPTGKLDTLLSQCGALLVARYRGQTRIEQINSLQELLKSAHVDRSGRIAAGRLLDCAGARQSPTRPTTSRDRKLVPQLVGKIQDLAVELLEDQRLIERTATSLEAEVRQLRMQPFAQACEGLDDLVRDLSSKLGKWAEFVVEGGDIRIDRSIIEGLRDLLRHLVRNALDHGLEPIAERTAAGKSSHGRITIAAVSLGDQVQISIADDGRGLNLTAIREQAQRSGAANVQDERELLRYIFLPGFSTSPTTTQVSGRGVGLDIVKSAVESMRGSVNISHSPGKGTTFTVSLPLTLTVIRALLVESGGQTFAFDTAAVQRIIRFSEQDIRSIEGRPVALTDAGPIPISDLSDWLGLPTRRDDQPDTTFPAVILTTLGREVAIIVDRVHAEQECLLRSLGPRLERIRSYSGGTMLSNGRVALVLNAAAVAEGAVTDEPRRNLALTVKDELKAKPYVLVADDSVTTRTLVQTILESAGYNVVTAVDGSEAWHIMQTQEIDALISDVDMPSMDGFILTKAVRKEKHLRDLPVILVTSRESDEDRKRGLQVGADAYLLKSTFDQRQLLDALAQFV